MWLSEVHRKGCRYKKLTAEQEAYLKSAELDPQRAENGASGPFVHGKLIQ